MDEKFFTVGKTAEIVGMTAETLRFYDRTGLVKPCRTDKWTGYRYYSENEIVKLNAVRALRCMDIPLEEIKQILGYGDLKTIAAALGEAEKNADRKIAQLLSAKEKIARARKYYQDKAGAPLAESGKHGFFKQTMPQRTILLSEKITHPTLDSLWNYHRHFYARLDDAVKDSFTFDDLAGIYLSQNSSHMFAVCSSYVPVQGLVTLPAGEYLCADCTEETRENVLSELTERVKRDYSFKPPFAVQIIVLSGILQWNYQTQVFTGKTAETARKQ